MAGFTPYQNITIENVTSLANVTEFPEFMVGVNNTVYGGWLYFILLWAVWFIIFKKSQDRNEDFMVNAMIAFGAVSIMSFFMRAITIVRNGLVEGLLTDHQLWVFPILAILLAVFIYANKTE